MKGLERFEDMRFLVRKLDGIRRESWQAVFHSAYVIASVHHGFVQFTEANRANVPGMPQSI
jgi:hypothetical protein